MNKSLLASDRMDWGTPPELVLSVTQIFGELWLDVAATRENTVCPCYIPKEEDGLKRAWSRFPVWCNPPYGRDVGRWVDKAIHETTEGGCPLAVLLLAARPDTRWFQRAAEKAKIVAFIRGRLRFVGAPHPAPFPSVLFAFGHDAKVLAPGILRKLALPMRVVD